MSKKYRRSKQVDSTKSREYLENSRKCRYADISFFLPTKMYLCSDWGTKMGSLHSHIFDFRASSRSLPPSHNATCSAPTLAEAAHSKNGKNSPTAREQTISRGAISSP